MGVVDQEKRDVGSRLDTIESRLDTIESGLKGLALFVRDEFAAIKTRLSGLMFVVTLLAVLQIGTLGLLVYHVWQEGSG